jgi:hypothetical protein
VAFYAIATHDSVNLEIDRMLRTLVLRNWGRLYRIGNDRNNPYSFCHCIHTGAWGCHLSNHWSREVRLFHTALQSELSHLIARYPT